MRLSTIFAFGILCNKVLESASFMNIVPRTSSHRHHRHHRHHHPRQLSTSTSTSTVVSTIVIHQSRGGRSSTSSSTHQHQSDESEDHEYEYECDDSTNSGTNTNTPSSTTPVLFSAFRKFTDYSSDRWLHDRWLHNDWCSGNLTFMEFELVLHGVEVELSWIAQLNFLLCTCCVLKMWKFSAWASRTKTNAYCSRKWVCSW